VFADQDFRRKYMRSRILLTFVTTLILAICSWASTEAVLYSLCSKTSCADGALPYSALVADSLGNLYGTTYQYGSNSSFPYGVVFELKHSGTGWTYIVLHNFAGGPTDGSYPRAPLVFDKAGNLYGTTYQGGAKNYGTVFVMKHSGSKWTESLIHSFLSTSTTDGYYPYAGLTFDAKGNIYGTTQFGGHSGQGTVFLLTPSNGKWTYRLIHNFAGGSDGAQPLGPITVGANGYYYGTTYYGGKTYNEGTVFRLFEARGVWIGQIVYAFSGGAGGDYPDSGLAMDASGNFYGTTYYGGANNLGTVYKLKAQQNNKFTQSVIKSFGGPPSDGEYPYYDSGVVLDTKGNIYGTTYAGGANSLGAVFELKPSGGGYKETLLHSFSSTADGYYPYGGVILFKGNVFGTTANGGAHGGGVVFEVRP
jgi:uncharacterized repeat protein (TIGR03803 family)